MYPFSPAAINREKSKTKDATPPNKINATSTFSCFLSLVPSPVYTAPLKQVAGPLVELNVIQQLHTCKPVYHSFSTGKHAAIAAPVCNSFLDLGSKLRRALLPQQ